MAAAARHQQHQFCLYHLLNTQNKNKEQNRFTVECSDAKTGSLLQRTSLAYGHAHLHIIDVCYIVVIIVAASSPKIKQNSNAIIKLSVCERDSCEFRASLLLLFLLCIGFVWLGFA